MNILRVSRTDREGGVPAGERLLPRDRYVGFAVGPQSEHDLVELVTPRGLVSVQSPGVVPIDVESEIEVRTVRLGGPTYLEVYGLTDKADLAGKWHRRPWRRIGQVYAAPAAPAIVATVPGGRRRVTFTMANLDGANAVTWRVYGHTYYAAGAFDPFELGSGSLGAGATDSPVAGGTDHAIEVDELALELTGAGGDVRVSIHASGVSE